LKITRSHMKNVFTTKRFMLHLLLQIVNHAIKSLFTPKLFLINVYSWYVYTQTVVQNIHTFDVPY
jgi:hypothetical protein